jgi:hypothetical protein
MTRKEKAYEVVQAMADNGIVWVERINPIRRLFGAKPEEIREKELNRLLSAARRAYPHKQHVTLGGLSSLTCCGVRQAYFWHFEAPRVPGFSYKVGSCGLLVCRVCGDTDSRTIGYVNIVKPPPSAYPPNDDDT